MTGGAPEPRLPPKANTSRPSSASAQTIIGPEGKSNASDASSPNP